jgi:predicted RNase H-like HicB family nuclease
MTIYVALVHGERGSYGVNLPDLPGCTSGGETIDTALAHLRLAASDWVEDVAAGGHAIPPARSIDELRKDPDYAEDFEDVVLAAAIEVDLPGGIERLSITMADALLVQIDKAAKKTGESRSGWLAAAARLRLRFDAGGVPFGPLRAKAPTKGSKSKGGASGKRAAAKAARPTAKRRA